MAITVKKTKISANNDLRKKKYIRAAEGDDEDDFSGFGGPDDDFEDDEFDEEGAPEEFEDEEDEEEQLEEDQPSIDIDNNISGRYIAECDRCHGIFISAVTESDQEIESLSGVCPLCQHQSNQYLKWVIKPIEEE